MTPDPITIRKEGAGGPRLVGHLWHAPAGAPGVVVVHGAESCKERHADFAEAAQAAGMAVLVPDLRGHGGSGGTRDGGMLDDVLAALDVLATAGAGPLGLRGSSLGGFLALHAAGRHPAVRAVAAICTARPEGLAAMFEDDWPLALALPPVVARADGVARGYWHAMGDEVVPWPASMHLATLTPPPCRLRIVTGGHHRSVQHDPESLAETVAFLAEHLGA